jgi:hypothetical protein
VRPHLPLPENLLGGPALGPPSGVGAVGVVVGEVAVQVQPQPSVFGIRYRAKAGFQRSSKIRLLDPFHDAVGLRPTRPDEQVPGPQARLCGLELSGAELGGVVAHHLLRRPALKARLAATRRESSEVPRTEGLGCKAQLRPAVGLGDVDRCVLLHRALRPRRAAR